MVDIVDIALYVDYYCIIILRGGGNVTGQCLFNVPDVTLFP